jgi:Uma2 family endonuclease
MSVISHPKQAKGDDGLELHTGDQMTREEFHRAYICTPEGFKAELIEGIVYVASPLKIRHGKNHIPLGSLFFAYEAATLGVESSDNTTIILGENAEPQPDLYLRILPDFGGQSQTTEDDYVGGAPELVAEIAPSSRSIDLHAKRRDYKRHGVLEYLVVSIREKQVRWFDLHRDQELSADSDGICRIRTFPGLWIDTTSLLARDFAKLMGTLQLGLATPEHAAFVARLAAAKTT